MITLPIPPLLNRLYKIGGNRIYKDYRAAVYKNQVWLACHEKKIKSTDANLELEIKWYRQRLTGDIDGILKCLLDSLEGCIYVKDSQVMKITIEKLHDKKNPRIELDYFLYEN